MGSPVSRALRRRRGLPNWRIVRYADDFVVLVFGSCDDAKALREEIADVLAPLGLRFSEAKTRVVHMNEGFDFLGATRSRMVRVSTLIGGLRPMTAA